MFNVKVRLETKNIAEMHISKIDKRKKNGLICIKFCYKNLVKCFPQRILRMICSLIAVCTVKERYAAW